MAKKQEPPKRYDPAAAAAQIRTLQNDVRYDLRDFVIDYLVTQFREELFYIPDYQRLFIWRDDNRCNFIESVILGLPIPMMFVADIEEDGRLEVVDGAQRIQTLESFMSNDLTLRGLTRLTELNGCTYQDLPVPDQNRFKTKAMRVVVLEGSTTKETRKEIFNRINTSGEKLKAAEIRRGAFKGRFLDFVDRCATNDHFLKLCPITDAMKDRREPQELILRFFAYSDRYTQFKHDVHKFLDKYVTDNRESFDEERLTGEFTKMLDFVDRYFPYGFAKGPKATSTPRVRFEAISVGTNLALRIDPTLRPHPVADWLESDGFATHTTTHATNSRPRLAGRVEYVRDRLLGKEEQ